MLSAIEERMAEPTARGLAAAVGRAVSEGVILAGEKLPGPHQPAIEIESVRYPSDLAAHNALVLNSRKGANVQQAAILGQAPGLCYQLDFYSKDHGTDWTCAYNKGRRLVTVRTVVTSPAFTVIRLTREVGRKL